MKKYLFALFILMYTSIIYSQEEEVIEEEIEIVDLGLRNPELDILIDIDTIVFTRKYGNDYYSDEGGHISYGIRSVSYEDMKAHMDTPVNGLISIEGKEIEINNELYLFRMFEQDRIKKKVILISFLKKYDDSSMLEIGGFCEVGMENKYEKLIRESAISARVNE
ncbi:MAG: hypothetical protein ACI9Y7_002399 [Dokdonia sp.]|jgi:hypothetical protein